MTHSSPPIRSRQLPLVSGKSPRVQVSLTPDAATAVRRLSVASRASMSSIVADIVNDAAPMLLRIAEAIEQMEGLTAEAKREVRRSTAAGEARAARLAATALAEFAVLENQLKEAARAYAPRQPAGPHLTASMLRQTRRR